MPPFPAKHDRLGRRVRFRNRDAKVRICGNFLTMMQPFFLSRVARIPAPTAHSRERARTRFQSDSARAVLALVDNDGKVAFDGLQLLSAPRQGMLWGGKACSRAHPSIGFGGTLSLRGSGAN